MSDPAHSAENDAPPVCYGCEHCGCDPTDPKDSCWVCDDCPADIEDAPRIYVELRPEELQKRLAEAWNKGWQAGNDDYDQGTDTPNPYRVIPPAKTEDAP